MLKKECNMHLNVRRQMQVLCHGRTMENRNNVHSFIDFDNNSVALSCFSVKYLLFKFASFFLQHVNHR